MSTGEKRIFEIVLERYDQSNIRCFVCNEKLNLLTHHNFAHVLSKGKYPKMRLEPRNIVIMCHKFVADNGKQGCHYDYDFKPHSELTGKNWQKLFDLRNQLLEEYKLL